MNTSMPSATARCWRVRIISRPVRSPTWASRAYLWPPKSRWEIRPSSVRSNSAPQSSSSRTRSGASWACSWAIRQLFSIFPPRMVSRKWTCQLSSGHRLPIAAAMPPSAITVWALPSSDLHTIAVRAPASWVCRSRPPGSDPDISLPVWGDGRSSEEPRVVEDVRRQQQDVEVHDRDGEQRVPGVAAVVGVEPGHEGPHPVAHRVPGEVPQAAAGDVPARVAGERVEPDQHDV